MSCLQRGPAGPAMRRRSHDSGHHVRGQTQSPSSANSQGSTNSAATSMLLSGSMSNPVAAFINLNLLSCAVLPCSSSLNTISASSPFPNVTLDLTHSPTNLLDSQKPQSLQFLIPQIFGQSPCTQSSFSGLQMPARAAGEQKLPSPADTMCAATTAFTADPKFMAALAATIRSIVGGGGDRGAQLARTPVTVSSDTEMQS